MPFTESGVFDGESLRDYLGLSGTVSGEDLIAAAQFYKYDVQKVKEFSFENMFDKRIPANKLTPPFSIGEFYNYGKAGELRGLQGNLLSSGIRIQTHHIYNKVPGFKAIETNVLLNGLSFFVESGVTLNFNGADGVFHPLDYPPTSPLPVRPVSGTAPRSLCFPWQNDDNPFTGNVTETFFQNGNLTSAYAKEGVDSVTSEDRTAKYDNGSTSTSREFEWVFRDVDLSDSINISCKEYVNDTDYFRIALRNGYQILYDDDPSSPNIGDLSMWVLPNAGVGTGALNTTGFKARCVIVNFGTLDSLLPIGSRPIVRIFNSINTGTNLINPPNNTNTGGGLYYNTDEPSDVSVNTTLGNGGASTLVISRDNDDEPSLLRTNFAVGERNKLYKVILQSNTSSFTSTPVLSSTDLTFETNTTTSTLSFFLLL